mmetsp:Transcript_24329/g.67647  ORF Transcript_24329/g.67647 Transcript_24329/m.67647 type:complete len:226 (-) Transcript_24329:221-898(-)
MTNCPSTLNSRTRHHRRWRLCHPCHKPGNARRRAIHHHRRIPNPPLPRPRPPTTPLKPPLCRQRRPPHRRRRWRRFRRNHNRNPNRPRPLKRVCLQVRTAAPKAPPTPAWSRGALQQSAAKPPPRRKAHRRTFRKALPPARPPIVLPPRLGIRALQPGFPNAPHFGARCHKKRHCYHHHRRLPRLPPNAARPAAVSSHHFAMRDANLHVVPAMALVGFCLAATAV